MDDRLNQMTSPGKDIIFNPDKDGNCQFEATAFSLNLHGVICITPNVLREGVVSYLRDNQVNLEYFPLELLPWYNDVTIMSCDRIYGDQITLQAISDIFSVEFSMVSSLGPDGHVLM